MTLIEILIVAVILTILAVVALPMVASSSHEAGHSVFGANLRVACDAFRLYYARNGYYPADSNPGIVPPGMAGDLKAIQWTGPTAIGGQWDWDFEQFGYTAGVSVYQPDRNEGEMAQVDKIIDDGNLNTGGFRKRTDGFICIIVP